MNGSLVVELGWFGFGIYRGLFPGVCAGPIKLMWVRGGLETTVQGWMDALREGVALVRSARLVTAFCDAATRALR